MSNYVSPGLMSHIILISGEDVSVCSLALELLLEKGSRYGLAYEVQMCWKCKVMSHSVSF